MEEKNPTPDKLEHISASKITIYRLCSLKYKFQYIDRLPRPFKSTGLIFGGVVHSALEWLHKNQVKGNPPSLEKLLKIFEADWFSQTVETEVRFKNGETAKDLVLLGRQLLSQYYHLDNGKPVDAEIPFGLPLLDPVTGETSGIILDGIIDLVEEGHAIAEFKTSAKTMNQDDADNSIQLTCYNYAYEMIFQARPEKLKIVNLVKTRTPKIVAIETQRGKEDYRRFFHLAKEVLNGVRNKVFFPEPCFMCHDCEYEEPCLSWSGNKN